MKTASRIHAFTLTGITFVGTDFGGVFDDVVASGGGTIRVPAGTYTVNRTLGAELNAPICIIGEGIFATRIVFANGDGADGFCVGGQFIGQTDSFGSIEVKDLAILKCGTGGSAVTLYCSAAEKDPPYPFFRFDNVFFSGVNHDAHYWGTAITLDGARHGTITRCHFRGFLNQVEGGMVFGINIRGYAGEVYVSKCFFQCMTYALHNNVGEGISVDNCHMVNILVGVLSERGPMLIVSNCHINAHAAGVKANTYSTIVKHNLFYHCSGSTYFCNMVEIVKSLEPIIDGNIFVDHSESRMNAIVLDDCNTGVVTGNLLSPGGREKVDSGLWIKAGSTDLRAFGNQFFGKITIDPGVDPATRGMIID